MDGTGRLERGCHQQGGVLHLHLALLNIPIAKGGEEGKEDVLK